MDKMSGRTAQRSVLLKSETIEFLAMFLAAFIIGIATLTEGTLLATHGRHHISIGFKVAAVLDFIFIVVLYIYRLFSDRPGAGMRVFIWGMLIALCFMFGLSIWSLVDGILQLHVE
jgi:hypothetical protein